MKTLVFLLAMAISAQVSAQGWTSIATDPSGDDYSQRPDADELEFKYNTNRDSLFLRLFHYTARGGDFGFIVAIDTNLNPADGAIIQQSNLQSGVPNLSMNYDVIMYIFQNGLFPKIEMETLNSSGGRWSLNVSVDTSNQHCLVISFRVADIGGKTDLNVVAFTGSFDIGPFGAGPSDVIPDNGYAKIRGPGVSLPEVKAEAEIYPIPAEDHFYLNYQGLVCFYDLQGRKVKETLVLKNEPIACDDLKPSLYNLTTSFQKPLGKLLKK